MNTIVESVKENVTDDTIPKLLELKTLCKVIEDNVKQESIGRKGSLTKEKGLLRRVGGHIAGRKLTTEESQILGIWRFKI